MSTNRVPEAVDRAARRKRGTTVPTSFGWIALEAKRSKQATINCLMGRADSDPGMVRDIAAAVGMSVEALERVIRAAKQDRGPWSPPAEASYLDDRQRRVLDDLIRVMAAPGMERPLAVAADDERPESTRREDH